MQKIFITFCIFCSISTILAGQTLRVPDQIDTIPGGLSEIGTSGFSADLRLLRDAELFILREIGGLYPTTTVFKENTTRCNWNDGIPGTGESVVSGGAPECRVFIYRNRIGLGFVDGSGNLLPQTAINAWRTLPFVKVPRSQ